MEAEFLAQHDEQSEMVEVARRIALIPRTANVDDEATVVLEDAVKLGGEELKPIDVLISLNIAVVLLTDQAEGRTSHDEVHGLVVIGGDHGKAVTVDDLSERGFVKGIQGSLPFLRHQRPLQVEPLEVHGVMSFASKHINDGRRARLNEG